MTEIIRYPHHGISVLPVGIDQLGECPLWDSREQALYWVDSKGREVKRLVPATGEFKRWSVPSDVGSIALADGKSVVLALEDGFHQLDLASGEVRLLAEVTHPASAMRFNDGRCDRGGRFLAGSMVVGHASREAGLYRLDASGRAALLDGDIAISNSLCFSPAGDRLYYSDSLAHAVYAYDYDSASGRIGQRDVLIDTAPFGSVPDGATVDAQGHLWVALVQAGRVMRFDPSGKAVGEVLFPVTHVSCPCFGGPELDILYVTSIRNSGNLVVDDHPYSGSVFAVHGLGVRGLEEGRHAQ
ncbi:SMP-30/gluconolactonase/LRE family protein [Achromobacter sp. GG226]|uniref:SMP-30/gluconolactonase/LRE family protein n=1 Tax=Verticiella alkaliphila TaxID=2779529 RepID=UPI001C0B5EA7|nr:SMP-30/gluconolactonase/LRE family protein [Verticiella sp. GG226]MBU4610416.1 SMP-30/gluconolactonase/LRE family protein [Verticiella sp. GG226]